MSADNNTDGSNDIKEMELAQCVLVDLDYLFDTRLGTISKMDEEFIKPLLDGGYWKRQHDFFNRIVPGIDMVRFKELYATRDWETLARTRYSNSILWLNVLTRKMERRMADTPYTFPVVVYLNIFPYQLTQNEIDHLGYDIKSKLALTTEIRIVSKSNEELTPTWVKEHVALIAKYDGDEWLAMYGDALTKSPMPTISVLLPALLRQENAISPMATGMDGKEYNLFDELPKAMAVLIDMLYVEPEEVSVINPLVVSRLTKSIRET